jgi:4a-hydroxytetrahydrobiopterin dehydratase
MKLSERTCIPVKSGDLPLAANILDDLLREIPKWSLRDNSITREFRFADFQAAMEFTNKAAAVAAEQDHHPDILIFYNRVRLIFITHKIKGLSLNDFIAAAKIDQITDQ